MSMSSSVVKVAIFVSFAKSAKSLYISYLSVFWLEQHKLLYISLVIYTGIAESGSSSTAEDVSVLWGCCL